MKKWEPHGCVLSLPSSSRQPLPVSPVSLFWFAPSRLVCVCLTVLIVWPLCLACVLTVTSLSPSFPPSPFPPLGFLIHLCIHPWPLTQNGSHNQDLLVCACAVGVATCFGAPIGGKSRSARSASGRLWPHQETSVTINLEVKTGLTSVCCTTWKWTKPLFKHLYLESVSMLHLQWIF